MQFSAISVRTSKETVAAIPPRLSRSFAWLAHTDGPPGSPRHSTSFIGYGYVRHSGLSFALQPPQSMSGNKMDDLRWSPSHQLKANFSKYRSTSQFGDFVHGTGWQMGHNSRQYPVQTRGASILPARIDSCV